MEQGSVKRENAELFRRKDYQSEKIEKLMDKS